MLIQGKYHNRFFMCCFPCFLFAISCQNKSASWTVLSIFRGKMVELLWSLKISIKLLIFSLKIYLEKRKRTNRDWSYISSKYNRQYFCQGATRLLQGIIWSSLFPGAEIFVKESQMREITNEEYQMSKI